MNIDKCYKNLIEKLTATGTIIRNSLKLASLKTESEKTLLVYSLLEDYNSFPVVEKYRKTNAQSINFRNLGNKCFQQTKYGKAWHYYNLALVNAPRNSDDFCIALSNRSAVFFEMGKYNESIHDIDKVMTLQYPKKLTDKLNRRRIMCLEGLAEERRQYITDQSRIDKIFKMKAPKHSTYVAASNKLEVMYNDQMGRHVVAKEDIGVGEVIVEEDPYFVLLLKSEYVVSCHYCLSRSLNLMPCDHCICSLYCSDICKEKAWKEYHEIECPLLPSLVYLEFTKLELLALRTVIKARLDHSSWSDLFKTIDLADANINTEHHGQVELNEKWIYDSKYYASIHSLSTNIDKRTVSDVFQKAVTAAVFLNFLIYKTNFLESSVENKEKIVQCVARLLLVHLMTSPTNMHGITSNLEDANGLYLQEWNLGCAPYAFCSLINHSCAPNVVRFTKLGTGRMTVFALRPIKKGMQIFDNYGAHHALEDLKSRQESLKFQYKFNCTCEACTHNWPTYRQMGKTKDIPNNIMSLKDRILCHDTIDMLQHGDKETALRVYRGLCLLCDKLDSFAPCREICDCQEGLKQCILIFEGLIPYGTTLQIGAIKAEELTDK